MRANAPPATLFSILTFDLPRGILQFDFVSMFLVDIHNRSTFDFVLVAASLCSCSPKRCVELRTADRVALNLLSEGVCKITLLEGGGKINND